MTAVDRLRKLCEAATPGPWSCPKYIGRPALYVYKAHGSAGQVARALSELRPDGEFIAAARNYLPLLLDLVEAYESWHKHRRGLGEFGGIEHALMGEVDTARAALERAEG